MKKTLLSLAFVAANFAFGQITLEHSFNDIKNAEVYTNSGDYFYIISTSDNKLKIYNSDFSLRKTVEVPMPAGYGFYFYYSGFDEGYTVSKNIFNLDDKYEFLIQISNSTTNNYDAKLLLVNEDGQLIKDFHPNGNARTIYPKIYHDPFANKNKLVVNTWKNETNSESFDVYSLPTSELTTKEIESQKKLSAFPIPTNKTLNIINPQNGANKIEVYDATGKMVVSKSFNTNENRISVEVENLPKGNYIYKIGNLSSKFIKN